MKKNVSIPEAFLYVCSENLREYVIRPESMRELRLSVLKVSMKVCAPCVEVLAVFTLF